MLLYSDNNTKEYEKNNKWIESIEYLYNKWKNDNYNKSLFLKTSINIWYVLIMDGCILDLTNEAKDKLNNMLLELFNVFESSFRNDANCQWMFGYMIEIGTYFFLTFKENIEEEGKNLIYESYIGGNLIAEYLIKNENCNERELSKLRNKIKKYVYECFSKDEEIDKYFIEVLLGE